MDDECDVCYLDKDGLMKPITKKKKENEINKVIKDE